MTDTRQQLSHLIKNGTPATLIKSEAVSNQFVYMYSKIHGISNIAQAQAFCEAEQFHFLKLINDNKNIAACTKLSLYGIFMDVAVSGLSFDPTMKHLYIVPYNVNVGTKQNAIWEKRAALQISGQGELVLRTKQGQVKYVDNPILVYEGDEFKYGSRDGKVILDHVANIPRKSTQIIACYLRITRHDDTVDYKVLTEQDMAGFRSSSKDPNSTAWTNSYPGMFQAKCIKHAFKGYPKLRAGDFSKMESETIDQTPEEIDYGFGASMLPDGEFTNTTEGNEGSFTSHVDISKGDNSQHAEPATNQQQDPVQTAATQQQTPVVVATTTQQDEEF